jgi:hypothetical protein
MPFSYVVYKDLRLVVSTGHDRVCWTEIKACQDQTKTDPNFNPQFDQIVDLRATTRFDMTGEQARVLARRMIFSFSSKRAIVASHPVAFGMGRMWETFTELSDNPSQLQVFHNLPLALRWLGREALPSLQSGDPSQLS